MLKFFLRTALLFSIVLITSGWGFLVHRTIGQLAIYELPVKMRPFFYNNLKFLVKEIVQPDLRRSTDSSEGARHFINLEEYGDSAAWKMPLHWNDAVRIYTKDSLLKNGYVPYAVIMEKNKLTKAFQSGNKDSILMYAADLSHYIGDAHVPLHVSVNYDGQLSHQKGLHNLWETMVPDIELNNYNLYSGHRARYLTNPEKAIWDAVRSAKILLAAVFDQEKQVSENFTDALKYQKRVRNGKEYRLYSPKFAQDYSKSLGATINEQLLKSTDLTADFWYTCWKDAGKPDLNKLLFSPVTSDDKKKIKQQCKAYRKNQLIKNNMLLARQIDGE